MGEFCPKSFFTKIVVNSNRSFAQIRSVKYNVSALAYPQFKSYFISSMGSKFATVLGIRIRTIPPHMNSKLTMFVVRNSLSSSFCMERECKYSRKLCCRIFLTQHHKPSLRRFIKEMISQK